MSKITELVPHQRKLTSWIESFCDYSEGTPTPLIFRKWAGVSAVAGALERRVWLHTAATPIYPNMFILFVAPPGVGKDQAIVPMRELWATTGVLNIAPISMTHKGLIDQLADPSSCKSYIDTKTNQYTNYHSLLVAVPELGVLMDSHDLGFMSALNELFNCWNLFEERQRTTRKGQVLRIENPHIHLITGTQPKYLGELLPEAAYGMGFTARIIMVYAGTPVKVSIFAASRSGLAIKQHLTDDLKRICTLKGIFVVDKDAEAAIEAWHLNGSDKDKPSHSRLMHYNARRIMHVLKISMAFSAARSDSLIISLEDFNNALSLLLETEKMMPEIFKEMASGGQAAEIEEAFHFIMSRYIKSGNKPVPESLIVNFLTARVPANQIGYIIQAMSGSEMIKEVKEGLNLPGKQKMFIPVALKRSE